jgi:hypothetical protein
MSSPFTDVYHAAQSHAFIGKARAIDTHSPIQQQQHLSLTTPPFHSFQTTMRLEAPIYCAASSSETDLVRGPNAKNMLVCICSSQRGGKVCISLAIQLGQRLQHLSVRLHPHRCSGLTAPDTRAARRCPGNRPQPLFLACIHGSGHGSLRSV